jgi:hypothetical protein
MFFERRHKGNIQSLSVTGVVLALLLLVILMGTVLVGPQTATAYTVNAAAINPGTVNALMSYGVGWRYLTDATDRAHLIKACQDFGINTLAAQIDGSVFGWISSDPATVATGIQALNAAGIRVWASWNGGSGGWSGYVAGHTWHEFFDAVLKWNKDHPTAKFTGLEFDLEPGVGKTDQEHLAHLQSVYAGMQTMRAHVVDGTETIASQKLPVIMWGNPLWGGTVCASAWAQVVSQLDVVEMDCNRWAGEENEYPQGIDASVAYNAKALAIVLAQGRYFICGLSCAELPKNLEASNPYISRFNLGRAAYQQAMQDYANYYKGLYPQNFIGYTSYYDIGGFMYWFNIDSVTSSPSGTFASGDTMTINYQTRRRTDRYVHRIFGVKMELKDSAGTITKANRIIDCEDGSTTNRTLSLIVPSGLANGAASVRLTMWAVGWYDDSYYDILYYDDYAGHSGELLAMTMDQLAAATTGPNGALQGKRSAFFILQDTGWRSGVTLATGTVPPVVTAPPAVTTSAATGIGTGSATLNGNLTSLGSASSVQVSFEWGLTTGYGNVTTPGAKTATGSFSASLTSLTPNTTYYYRAKAVGASTTYGTTLNFTTSASGTTTLAIDEVTNPPQASGISATGATLSAVLLSLGGRASVQANFGVQPVDGAYYETAAKTLYAAGSFSVTLTGLTPSTTYYFRAQVRGTGGYDYTATMSFTTLAA